MALGEFNHRAKWIAAWIILGCLLFAVSEVRSADRLLRSKDPDTNGVEKETGEGFAMKLLHFFWQSGKSSYQPVWPDMAFGWRLVLGSVVGFFGAALGSVGGVGGGGIFVPMLTLIIGFDPKSWKNETLLKEEAKLFSSFDECGTLEENRSINAVLQEAWA